jgi:hypothetical protein
MIYNYLINWFHDINKLIIYKKGIKLIIININIRINKKKTKFSINLLKFLIKIKFKDNNKIKENF